MSISLRITCCFLLSGPRKETHCRWIARTSPPQQTQEVISDGLAWNPGGLTGNTGGVVQTGGVYAFMATFLSEFRLMWGRYLSTWFSLGEKRIFAVLSSGLMFCWCVEKVSASLEAFVLRTLRYSVLRLFEECFFLLFKFLWTKSYRDPLAVIGKSHFEYIYSKYMDHSV